MRNLSEMIELVKHFEGLRLDAYLDPVGIWTIGYGTTVYPSGAKVKRGDRITEQQAEELMMNDLKEKGSKYVDHYVKVPLNDNQYGALTSFIYNVGSGNFSKSTLLKKLNAGDYLGAANEFKRWNKGGGKVLAGLVRRRSEEEKLFRKEMIEMPPAQPEPKRNWIDFLKDIVARIMDFIREEKEPVGQQPLPETPEIVTLSKGNGPRISREECEKILRKSGADTSKVCLLGIRGYYLDSMGVKGKNDRGIWDDALIWFFPEGFMTFRANTDPSSYRKGSGFGSGKGMANLMEGHWTYKTGMHNGSRPHMAFRQADKVTVLRDGNPPYPNTGWFGINIHSGGRGTSSLGCQTIPREQWKAFKELGYEKLDQYNQKTFSYVLIKEESRR